MQNITDMSALSARLLVSDKDSDSSANNGGDVVKKLRLNVSTTLNNSGNSNNSSNNTTNQYETSPSSHTAASVTSDDNNDTTTRATTTTPSITTPSGANGDQVAPNPSYADCDRPHYFQASLIGDKYLLLDQVDGSTLYRCVNVHTQQELVCKVVTRDSTNLITAHYRLESDPHVSSLHEVLMGDRYLYLVFPRAHGDLHSYVRQRRRIREPEARRLFRQVAETVKACHKEGIVLRDLKLRKFVFADSQRTELKLESLEDAVVLEEPENDWLHDKRGCPAYVSPEILRAGAHYSGKAADMWSLGVILYTMLVGRYPFNDSEHASLFAKISRGHFVIPDCLSSRARCLIRSLLRREPSERITSEDVLYHPWLTYGDRESTAALAASRQCDQLVPSMPAGFNLDDDDDDTALDD